MLYLAIIIEWGWVGYEEFCRSRSRRPRWITPSEICRILHILWKPNSITALLFIQNIFLFLTEFRHFALCFSAHQKYDNLVPRFLVNSSIICRGLHFWRHRFNNLQRAALLTSLVQYLVNSNWLWWNEGVICRLQVAGAGCLLQVAGYISIMHLSTHEYMYRLWMYFTQSATWTAKYFTEGFCISFQQSLKFLCINHMMPFVVIFEDMFSHVQ